MLTALGLLTVVSAIPVQSQQRPNVVIVLVDDLGWQDTSLSFGLEHKLVGRQFKTPNLEQLAARGLCVDQAYASCAVCTPTRVALLTGVNPARSRITSWVHSGQDTDGGHPGLKNPDWNKKGLQPGDAKTLAEVFREAGYRTLQVGKAHFGAAGTAGADPTNLGFDRTIGGSAAGHPNSFYGLDNFAAKKSDPNDPPKHNDVPDLGAYHGKDIYLTEALTLETVKEIESATVPLFLWFSPYAVHTPIQANKRLLASYSGLDPIEAAYATMVESVDNALGEIVAALERAGKLENSIVLFTSDNGGLSQVARGGFPNLHNLPLRSGKGSAYEGGTRVPLVLAGPGIAKGKSLRNYWVTSADLFSTVARLAGLTVDPRDGVSFESSLAGATDAPRSAPNVWHYPHHRGFGGPGLEPHSAIRSGDFKAVFFYGTRSWELYNLRADIGETRNVAHRQQERLKELSTRLLESLKEMEAQFPVDEATGKEILPLLP